MSRTPKRIVVGFTGTRKGMTEFQKTELKRFLQKYGGTFHHGGCIGADAEAHAIAGRLGYHIVMHPSYFPRLQVPCIPDERREPLPPIVRNHNIVDESFALVACPGTMEEELRSGTWATIRYARKLEKPVTIIYPRKP
jgi:hypothetical protein